jgi:hypothetical protein
MNASYSPESSVQSTATPDWPQPSRQAPSVPISVYRELATELKATQALVDSLTQQNQQLGQQNQLLRQEMVKFADSAAQLKQVVEASLPFAPEVSGSVPSDRAMADSAGLSPLPAAQARWDGLESGAVPSGALSKENGTNLASQFTQMLKPRAQAPTRGMAKSAPRSSGQRPQPLPPQRLYTEERLEVARPTQGREKSADLSGLWLATTIVLIVVSAFGAGFLIMRPLLNNSR